MNELSKRHNVDTGWDSPESKKNWEAASAELTACKQEITEFNERAQESKNIAETLERERKELTRGHNPTGAGFGPKSNPQEADIRKRELALRGWIRDDYATDEEYQARQDLRLRRAVEIGNGSQHIHRDMAADSLAYTRSSGSLKGYLLSPEYRANLSAYQFNLGGSLVGQQTADRLEVNMLSIGALRRAGTTITTSGGNLITYPTVDDTSNTGALVGEAVASSETLPSFNGISYGAHKYTSNIIPVPRELIEDSGYDIVSYLVNEAIPRRLTDVTEGHFATGDGAGKPRGLVTDASQGVETASQTAFTRKEIEQLKFSVDESYRSQPGCGWAMHDSVMAQVRILQDSNGVFNFINGTDPNLPERLSGYPVFITNKMASTLVQSAKVMLFGQLSKYWIRRAGGVLLRRAEEYYFSQDMIAFVAFVREDAKLMDAGTKPVKYLQMKTT